MSHCMLLYSAVAVAINTSLFNTAVVCHSRLPTEYSQYVNYITELMDSGMLSINLEAH